MWVASSVPHPKHVDSRDNEIYFYFDWSYPDNFWKKEFSYDIKVHFEARTILKFISQIVKIGKSQNHRMI